MVDDALNCPDGNFTLIGDNYCYGFHLTELISLASLHYNMTTRLPNFLKAIS